MKPKSNDLYRRILITIGLIILWRLFVFIPAPGIDSGVVKEFFPSNGDFKGISILALGIMPYVSAYVLVELFSLFLPPLKSWRKEGSFGRRKLLKTALVVTVFLSIVHGYIQSYMVIRGFNMVADGEAVNLPSTWSHLQTALPLTVAVFFTLWIAHMITKKGVGHGISVIFFGGYAVSFLPRLYKGMMEATQSVLRFEQFTFEDAGRVVLILLVLFVFIAIIVVFERSVKKIPVEFDDGTKAHIPIKLTTAGTVPIGFGREALLLPILLLAGVIPSWVQQQIFFSDSTFYYPINLIALVFLYYFFTFLFYSPERMIELLKSKNSSIVVPEGEDPSDLIKRSLKAMALAGLLYLSLFLLLSRMGMNSLTGGLVGVGLILTVVIAMDISGEVLFRSKSGRLSKVAEFHNIPIAGLAKSLLEERAIPCHLKGYYHRALLYFFGPYIEVSLLVPEDKSEEAKELMKRYLAHQ
ncbi:MAG: DUF2007 domain-containing protein [Deltaproteobacteria bacterium]|nr:DUF2007 domain-containing protein [Deltaproteobacteria bacterium]